MVLPSKRTDSPQGIWDNIAEKMLVEFAESVCPMFRATTPLSRCKLKSKGHGKLSIHFAADELTIETIFSHTCFLQISSVFFTEQSQTCVKNANPLHDRSGRPDMVMGQSVVLSEIKTEVSLDCDDQRIKIFYCNNMENELKSCHNKID